jgi:hypothetical protein
MRRTSSSGGMASRRGGVATAGKFQDLAGLVADAQQVGERQPRGLALDGWREAGLLAVMARVEQCSRKAGKRGFPGSSEEAPTGIEPVYTALQAPGTGAAEGESALDRDASRDERGSVSRSSGHGSGHAQD